MSGTAIDLLSCPFCWGRDAVLEPCEISPGVWAVVCKECGAQGPSNHPIDDYSDNKPNATIEQAVAEWNQRA